MTTSPQLDPPPAQTTRPLVALLGNPNTGKSTVFNRLTGMRQRIANYPGITFDAKVGTMTVGETDVDILDLPGAYSLSATSPDEEVVIDALTGHGAVRKPDLIVCVADASNLKRNLFLASQLAEFDMPMVLVLNQWDVVLRRQIRIDPGKLSKELGIPVLTTVGTKGTGLEGVRNAIGQALRQPARMKRIAWRPEITEATGMIREASAEAGSQLTEQEAQRILFDSRGTLRSRLPMPPEAQKELVSKARDRVRAAGLNPPAAEAILHYERLGALLERAAATHTGGQMRGSESIDTLLVHRFWGTLIFVGVMWIVFQSVYSWAGPFMDLIDSGTGSLQGLAGPLLESTPALQSLVVDGIIGGVGGVVIFLPQIFILFLFIAILEDSGYMSRAAFLMDKLFGWCGLNGKSFVPLLSSYACSIPGIMAARALEDPKARLTTVLIAPFMSCSARLPVYVLLIGAFIEPVYGAMVAGWVLFAMHFVGLLVALPLAWVLNRFILKLQHQPFILEMTSYKIPDVRNILLKMWEGGREFLVRAGTVILAFSVVIWALLYFPHSDEVPETERAAFIAEQVETTGLGAGEIESFLANPESEWSTRLDNRIESAYLEQSYLGTMGKFVQPVFAPAGFDWKITVGVLSSFPAREVIIATLGIIYNLGADVDEESDGLRETMAAETWKSGPRAGEPVFTIPVVIAIMLFFALCMQCGATVAVIARQIGWSWAAISFFGMTGIAWLVAVIAFQLGSLF